MVRGVCGVFLDFRALMKEKKNLFIRKESIESYLSVVTIIYCGMRHIINTVAQ